MRHLLTLLALAAFLILTGCGGGDNTIGGGDPPNPPPPQPPAKTVSGMATFHPNTANPYVALVVTATEGDYQQISAVAVTKQTDATDWTKYPFEIKLPNSPALSEYHLITFNDRDVDGVYDAPTEVNASELIGEWEYKLIFNGTWQVSDVFNEIPEWGSNATLCTGDQILINGTYEE